MLPVQSQPQAPDGGSAVRGEYPKLISRSEAAGMHVAAPHILLPHRPTETYPAKKDGVRRPKPDPDALRLVWRRRPFESQKVHSQRC